MSITVVLRTANRSISGSGGIRHLDTFMMRLSDAVVKSLILERLEGLL